MTITMRDVRLLTEQELNQIAALGVALGFMDANAGDFVARAQLVREASAVLDQVAQLEDVIWGKSHNHSEVLGRYAKLLAQGDAIEESEYAELALQALEALPFTKLLAEVPFALQREEEVRKQVQESLLPAVRQTACRFCGLDIENFLLHPARQYPAGEWRDRGGNTSCNDGKHKHAPVIEK